VVGGARLAYPEAFCAVHLKSWQHLIVLGVVTVTVGNALFALNRYGLHQLVEYILYLLKVEGPIPKAGRFHHTNDLAEHVVTSFQTGDFPKGIRQHIAFRISTVLLLLTLGEIALAFSWCHSKCSILNTHEVALQILGVAALVAYAGQLWLTRRIDYFVVTKKLERTPDKEHA
jgi:hypothetical protein